MRDKALSLLKFGVEALFSKEKREWIKAIKEVGEYVPWKIVQVLYESKLAKEMAAKPFSEYPDPKFAWVVAKVLEDYGYVKIQSNKVEWLKQPEKVLSEPPAVTSPLLLETLGVIDRVVSTLPEALRTGSKPLLYTGEAQDAKAVFAKFLDNTGYSQMRMMLARDVAHMEKLPPSALVVDVGSGIGASVTTLLELTDAKIIATDPYPENLKILRNLVKLMNEEERVIIIKTRGEELSAALRRAGIESVDAAFMVNVLHWSEYPVKVLKEVRKVLRDGFLAMMQGTLDNKRGRLAAVITYLMGSSIQPWRHELLKWIAQAKFKVKKHETFPIDMFLLTP